MKFPFAGLFHVVEAVNVFRGVAQVTGAQKAADLADRGTALLSNVASNAEEIASFNGDIASFVAAFGPLAPDAPLAQMQEKIAKYESDLSSLTNGTPVTIGDADVSVAGKKYRVEVTLKAIPI